MSLQGVEISGEALRPTGRTAREGGKTLEGILSLAEWSGP